MNISCDREKEEDYPDITSSHLVEVIPNSELISLESVSKLLRHDNAVLCFMSCANISKMIDRYKEINK